MPNFVLWLFIHNQNSKKGLYAMIQALSTYWKMVRQALGYVDCIEFTHFYFGSVKILHG